MYLITSQALEKGKTLQDAAFALLPFPFGRIGVWWESNFKLGT
jgi:hypothetical protein